MVLITRQEVVEIRNAVIDLKNEFYRFAEESRRRDRERRSCECEDRDES